jgi:hypothetical protein
MLGDVPKGGARTGGPSTLGRLKEGGAIRGVAMANGFAAGFGVASIAEGHATGDDPFGGTVSDLVGGGVETMGDPADSFVSNNPSIVGV